MRLEGGRTILCDARPFFQIAYGIVVPKDESVEYRIVESRFNKQRLYPNVSGTIGENTKHVERVIPPNGAKDTLGKYGRMAPKSK